MDTTREPASTGSHPAFRPSRRPKAARALRAAIAALAIAVAAPSGTALAQQAIAPNDRLSWSIYRELITLPYYGVFDHLSFEVQKGGTVILRGAVRRPSLKEDAEARVKEIEGVEQVQNEVEVLPASPQDDSIRLALYRAIYRHDGLERYGLSAVPSIHIIVDRGHVRLEGIVNSKMDRQLAEAEARSVPGTFSITNNLQVES